MLLYSKPTLFRHILCVFASLREIESSIFRETNNIVYFVCLLRPMASNPLRGLFFETLSRHRLGLWFKKIFENEYEYRPAHAGLSTSTKYEFLSYTQPYP